MNSARHDREKKHEKRTAGELAQLACSMTGFACHCSSMPDVSVVIFGERDCANAFRRFSAPFGVAPKWTIYSASLDESHVIAGKAEARLEACLREVARLKKPVIVLSTCLTEMIGADPVPVCRRVAGETGVRIVAVPTSGLIPRTQAAAMDWFAEIMWRHFAREGEVDAQAVNFIGYDTHQPPDPRFERFGFRRELEDVLSVVGLRLNAAVPAGAHLKDWESLPIAGLTFIAERALYANLCSLIESDKRKVIEVPPPAGLHKSDYFYRALAEYAQADFAFVEELPLRSAAQRAIEKARTLFSGRTLAYGIGSHHNFDAPQLVYDGLADVALFKEMGFKIVLVIQERDRPDVHERIRRNLAVLGLDLPYQLFYEPAVLAPILREVRADLAYISDFLADQADLAGVPMIRLGSMRPGYRGVLDAVTTVSKTLCGGFEARYRKYLAK